MLDSDPVLEALVAELDRTLAVPRHAPSHAVLRVTETRKLVLGARHGALDAPTDRHDRVLAADIRHGPPELDSSHPLHADEPRVPSSGPIPVEDDPGALRHAIWAVLAPALRDSEDRLARVRAERGARATASDPSPDRSVESPVYALHCDARGEPPLDREFWERRLVRLSRRLHDPRLVHGSVGLRVRVRTTWVVATDGSRVRHRDTLARVDLEATASAPDGARITRSEGHHAHTPGGLPGDEALDALADGLKDDVLALAAAPEGEPASGPVLLAGPAAAVWLHEVVGHRVEGHRQKDDQDGQTFRGCVGRAILPAGFSIWDDPTVRRLAGEDLAGHYLHDDEGRPAERADVVRDGVFVGFLTSRSPIAGFPRSNGHGRASAWLLPVSRMGNTVLEVAEPAPAGELRERLVALARQRGRPWGLWVDRLTGGFTLTGRFLPNAFSLTVARAWRVWTDGRPDERVRGLDVVGTPLAALGSLLAAGDDPAVFNGTCGAESGQVPVAAVSPSLLFGDLEVQRQWRDPELAPVLPAPAGPVSRADDVLVASVDRTMGLRLADVPSPHFVGFVVRDAPTLYLDIVPGAIERRTSDRDAELGVAVRVGGPALDSANFGSDEGFDAIAVPPGDAPQALARAAWLLAERAWKAAAEGLAGKVAARRGRPTDAARPSDFAPEPGVVWTDPRPAPPDPEGLEVAARTLATALAAHPDLLEARGLLYASAGTQWVVDSLGTRVVRAEESVAAVISATIRASDGREAQDIDRTLVARVSDLDAGALAEAVDALALRLRAWTEATVAGEEWTGPVLLTGAAALIAVRDLLLPGLCSTPAVEWPEPEPGGRPPAPFRLGRRALPAGWSVVDDPMTWPHHSSCVRIDDEGVPSGALRLIGDGLVRTLLASRTPGPDAPRSNGRACGMPGELARAAPTQVTVTAPSPLDLGALRSRAVALAAELGLDAALEIRRLSPGGEPLDASWLGADGADAPVRGLRFVGLGRSALLDVVDAGPSVVGTVLWHPVGDPLGDRATLGGTALTLSTPAVLLRRVSLAPDGAQPTRELPLPPPGRQTGRANR